MSIDPHLTKATYRPLRAVLILFCSRQQLSKIVTSEAVHKLVWEPLCPLKEGRVRYLQQSLSKANQGLIKRFNKRSYKTCGLNHDVQCSLAGQSTVEYLLVLIGFLGMLCAVGVLYTHLHESDVIKRAATSIDHQLKYDTVNILLY